MQLSRPYKQEYWKEELSSKESDIATSYQHPLTRIRSTVRYRTIAPLSFEVGFMTSSSLRRVAEIKVAYQVVVER